MKREIREGRKEDEGEKRLDGKGLGRENQNRREVRE